MDPQHLREFTAVDQASDPAQCVSLMDSAQQLTAVQRCRQQALAALHLCSGERVLDVGCGTGEQTLELARRVAPDGEAVGIDFSEVMIGEAAGRSEGAGLPVRFEQGDAQQLRFADATFDACRTERMLIHVPDAEAAITEMVRVTRPGGRVAAIDVDMEAALLDASDVVFTGVYLRSFADSLSNGRIGRRLPRIFRQVGLTDVTVAFTLIEVEFEVIGPLCTSHFDRLRASGEVALDVADRWWADIQEAVAAGTFLMALPMVVVSGRRPLTLTRASTVDGAQPLES